MALDTNSTVWTFKSWGEPIQLISPSLDCSSPETTPIQIECGDMFSAALTRSGDVYAWWLNRGDFDELYWEIHETSMALVPDHEAAIPCRTLELKTDPIKLPAFSDLPDLPATGLPGGQRSKETRLIKIAACSSCLIGLTNKGHVLKLDGLSTDNNTWIWDYVSENVGSDSFS